jgi:hypothetical protein
VNPLPKIRSGAAAAGQKAKGAGKAVVSKPRAAGSALAGGFKWAGSGVASQTKAAGRAVGDRTKRTRGAVAAKTSPPWNAAKQKFQSHPQVGIAAIVGALLVIAWIAWAIYVASTNGANAGLGVVISWPAVFMAVALVAAPFVGLYLLIRRLQGNDPSDPPIAGGAPDEGEASEANSTAGTYPG